MKHAHFLIRCINCSKPTSKQHANAHDGLCAHCVKPTPTRDERILESGYMAYAIEEGHYDFGGDE